MVHKMAGIDHKTWGTERCRQLAEKIAVDPFTGINHSFSYIKAFVSWVPTTIHNASCSVAKTKTGKEVNKPNAVPDYNYTTGGVDKADLLPNYTEATKTVLQSPTNTFNSIINAIVCLCITDWMSPVMRLNRVFGSTMFGMLSIRDVWRFYSRVFHHILEFQSFHWFTMTPFRGIVAAREEDWQSGKCAMTLCCCSGELVENKVFFVLFSYELW